jgi:2-dehydro-3-deoxyphosphogluconate aldolase/(4S)-4-hydroxy-2-oxoglutarate aldolase
MTARERVVASIEEAGVIAVIRLADARQLHATVDSLVEGGVRVLEVTMTVPRAVDLIRELSGTLRSDLLLGAGTVLDVDTGVARDGCRRAVRGESRLQARDHRAMP